MADGRWFGDGGCGFEVPWGFKSLGYLGAALAGTGLEESPNTSRQHAVYNTRGPGSKGLGHGKCHREKTARRQESGASCFPKLGKGEKAG